MNEKLVGHVSDLLRTLGILAIATALLMLSNNTLPDPALGPLLSSTAIVMYAAAFTYITRRILLPYVQLKKLFVEGAAGSLPAAILACSVIYIMGIIIQSVVVLLK